MFFKIYFPSAHFLLNWHQSIILMKGNDKSLDGFLTILGAALADEYARKSEEDEEKPLRAIYLYGADLQCLAVVSARMYMRLLDLGYDFVDIGLGERKINAERYFIDIGGFITVHRNAEMRGRETVLD